MSPRARLAMCWDLPAAQVKAPRADACCCHVVHSAACPTCWRLGGQWCFLRLLVCDIAQCLAPRHLATEGGLAAELATREQGLAILVRHVDMLAGPHQATWLHVLILLWAQPEHAIRLWEA